MSRARPGLRSNDKDWYWWLESDDQAETRTGWAVMILTDSDDQAETRTEWAVKTPESLATDDKEW